LDYICSERKALEPQNKSKMAQEIEIMKAQGKQLAFIVIGLGLLMFLWSYLGDPTVLFKYWWLGILYQWILPIGLAIYAVAKAKQSLDGFISFKGALGTSVIGLILGTAVVVLFNTLMYNVVDPDFKDMMEEKTIEFTVQFMERMGADKSQISEGVSQLKERDQFGFKAQIMGLTFISIYYLVIGLIVAAAMKKDEPVV
jgi:hypothetical protein